ncbi:MAG TPA: hypothetical protein DC006_07340 [Prevotellaceae bacterium]|nr:hypothetical protein [Prevotellaceae bacterium]
MPMGHLIHIANIIVSLFLAPGMILALGIAVWGVAYTHCESLACYARARRIVGATFVLYGLALVAEHFVNSSIVVDLVTRLVIVAISMSQAYLFTLTLLTLLDVEFLSARRLRGEAVLPLLATMAAFTAGALCPVAWHTPIIVAYQVTYGLLLLHYIRLFRSHYAYYEQRMDNYFSDEEQHRLHWVRNSFRWSLCIGVAALVYSVFPCEATSLPFMLAAMSYYTFYGIHFINYAHIFPHVASALAEPVEPMPQEQTTMPTPEEQELLATADRLMDTTSLYTDAGLTIAQVAVALGRPHRTLSAAISHGRHTTFKAYVNGFRVAKACRLIGEGWLAHHTIDALGAECGFSSRVHFYRIFKQATGVSPSEYTPEGNNTGKM